MHQFGQMPADDQTDAGAGGLTAFAAQAVEGLEELGLLGWAHPQARVGHGHAQRGLLGAVDLAAHAHRHTAVGAVVLDGVAQQVGQDLTQAGGIGMHPPVSGHGFGAVQGDALFEGLVLNQAEGGLEGLGHRHRLAVQSHVAAVQARDVEHVVDHVQQVPARLLDLLHPAALRGGQRRRGVQLHHLGKAQHRVERCAQLMAHARQEFRLGPVGLVGGRVLAAGLLHGVLQAAGVARHHQQQRAQGGGQQGADHGQQPEGGAVTGQGNGAARPHRQRPGLARKSNRHPLQVARGRAGIEVHTSGRAPQQALPGEVAFIQAGGQVRWHVPQDGGQGIVHAQGQEQGAPHGQAALGHRLRVTVVHRAVDHNALLHARFLDQLETLRRLQRVGVAGQLVRGAGFRARQDVVAQGAQVVALRFDVAKGQDLVSLRRAAIHAVIDAVAGQAFHALGGFKGGQIGDGHPLLPPHGLHAVQRPQPVARGPVELGTRHLFGRVHQAVQGLDRVQIALKAELDRAGGGLDRLQKDRVLALLVPGMELTHGQGQQGRHDQQRDADHPAARTPQRGGLPDQGQQHGGPDQDPQGVTGPPVEGKAQRLFDR